MSKYLYFDAHINAALEYYVKSEESENEQFDFGTHNMGLWICDSNNSPIIPEFGNCKIEYTRNEDKTEKWKFYSKEQVWEDAIPVDDARAMVIYSYYPYNENVSDITKIPFVSEHSNYFYTAPVQLTEDMISSNKINVNLEYKPIMTCMEIAVIANSADAVKLNGITLNVLENSKGIPTKGTYNAITGDIETVDEDTANKLEYITSEGLLLTTDATTTPVVHFIFPKYLNYDEDFSLSFKFNGVEGLTTYTIPNNLVTSTGGYFKEGYKYSITLQLNEEMKFSVVKFRTTDDWNKTPVDTDIEL